MPIVTPGGTPARVQELQLTACHLLCEMVEDALFPRLEPVVDDGR